MAIAFNAAADLGNNGGTTSSLTVSYTVGSGANRLLVVGFMGDVVGGVDDVTSVTYGGVAMTLAAKNTGAGAVTPSSDRMVYLYYLAGPASGANNVVVTCGSNHYIIAVAADYTGVGSLDVTGSGIQAANANVSTSLTIPLTTTAANDWIIEIVANGAATTAVPAYTSTNMTSRIDGVAFNEPQLFDMSTTTVGAYSPVATTDPFENMDIMAAVAAFKPAGAAATIHPGIVLTPPFGGTVAALGSAALLRALRRNRMMTRRGMLTGQWWRR